MPVIKSAKKALRVSIRRKSENDLIRKNIKGATKDLRSSPTVKTLSKVYSVLDRAVKKHVIHRNKAARLKGALSKLVKPASSAKKTSKK